MIDVVMPQLGESVAEGTVTKWLVRGGDLVSHDQVIVEVATDKADTEVRAPAAGQVTEILAAEGALVPVRGLLCRIDDFENPPRPRSRKPRRPRDLSPLRIRCPRRSRHPPRDGTRGSWASTYARCPQQASVDA